MLTLRIRFDSKDDNYIREKLTAIRSRINYQLKDLDLNDAFRWGFQQNNSGFVMLYIDNSKVSQLLYESNDCIISPSALPTDSELLHMFILEKDNNKHILGCEMLYKGEECNQYKKSQYTQVEKGEYFSIDHIKTKQ